jgi:hypothetical protein
VVINYELTHHTLQLMITSGFDLSYYVAYSDRKERVEEA